MKKLKRILGIVLSVLLVITNGLGGTGITIAFAADDTNGTIINEERLGVSDVTKDFSKEILVEQTKKELKADSKNDFNAPEQDEEVWVIVQMDKDSIIDNVSKMRSSLSVKEFANSSEGKGLASTLIEGQNQVKESIKENGISAEYKESYTVLLNGFAAKVKYKDIKEIEKLPQVKDVILSTYYYTDSVSKNAYYEGSDMSNVLAKAENEEVSKEGEKVDATSKLKGTGMVISVLDTGLDYRHSAFQKSPVNYSMTKESIAKTFKDTFAYSTGKASLEDVYHSPKLPYMFDYADVDSDVAPTEESVSKNGNDHGTHVAGIVSGNDEKLIGVAPEAQLIIMKVFSDKTSGAATIDILAALNDSVILGADVINMSLGSSGGFASEESDALITKIYDAVTDNGINLVISAGNAYSSPYSSPNGDLGLTSNPDTGIIGSPSSYGGPVSVASIDANPPKKIIVGDNVLLYNEVDGHVFAEELKESSYEYVMVPGFGSIEDYKNIDVKGKIAVVKRGSLSFNDKQINASEKGAEGCIIYNNRSGYLLNMAITDYKIPTIAISFEAGGLMAEASKKVVELSTTSTGSPMMSDFSSWGPLPNLTLKPEITAPGGNIYSALPFQQYGYMSGTSMAAPWFAGAEGLVRQYIEENNPSLSAKEVRVLVNRLLMSTAVPALDQDGIKYSPRKQGAGVANIDNAVNTPAYLYVYGQDKPKLELGDDKDENGHYTLSFHLKNMTTRTLSYNITANAMTESVTENGINIAQKSHMFDDAAIEIVSVTNADLDGNTVTVGGSKDATITVEVTLTDGDKKYMRDNFENGIYVEGFVSLDANDDKGVDLSIPYLTFFGDWTKAPLMDSNIYDDESPIIFDSHPVSVYALFYSMIPGTYLFDTKPGVEVPAPSDDKIAIGLNKGNGLGGIDFVAMGLLRGAKEVKHTLKDKATGKVVAEYTDANVRKARYNQSTGGIYPAIGGGSYPKVNVTAPEDSNAEFLYTVEASVDQSGAQNNESSSWTFPIKVDYEYPTIEGALTSYEKDGRNYIDFKLSDNQYLMATTLYSYEEGYDRYGNWVSGPGDNYYDFMTPIYDAKPYEESSMTFDITKFKNDFNKGRFYIVTYDYAFNESIYLIEFPTVKAEGLSLDKSEETMKINEAIKLNATFMPENTTNKNIKWTSSNEKVAVVKDGEVTSLSEGEAIITAESEDGGFKAVCNITVTSEIAKPIEISKVILSNSTLDLVKGKTETLTADFEPWNATDKTITWTSSDETVATVKYGTVTAVKAGTSTITAKSTNGVSAECIVNVSDPEAKFTIIDDVLTAYNGTEEHIIIPDGVKTIGKNVFKGNTTIKDVKLPNTLESIDASAFDGCKALEVINMPDSLKNIGNNAFSSCEALKEINIPSGVLTIGNYAFNKCSSIKEITLSKSLISMGNSAISYMTSLEKVTINNGLTEFGSNAFSNNAKLTNVVLPDDMTVLPSGVFLGCTSLEKVDLKNINKIDQYAFQSTGIKNINIPKNVTEIGKRAFATCKELVSVNFEGEINGAEALFYDDDKLITVTGGLKTIEKDMFKYCDGLSKFALPDSVASIADTAFYKCINLSEIIISKDSALKAAGENIGVEVFKDSTKFKKFTVDASNPNLSAVNGILCDKDAKLIFAVPFGMDLSNFVMPDSIEEIVHHGFYKNPTLQNVTFSKNLKKINEEAFFNCSKLTKIGFKDGLETIGTKAFSLCSNMAEITFGEGLKTIGDEAFFNSVAKVKTIELPDTLKTVGTKAFYGCKAAITIDLGKGVEVVGESAFYNCNAAATIVLSENLKTVGREGFYGCNKVTELKMPGTLETIGDWAFYNCYNLSAIDIPGSVNTIGEFAFYQARGISSLTFGEGVKSIGKNAFGNMNYYYSNYGCKEPVKTINIPASVTYIEPSTFFKCNYLESIFVDPKNTAYASTDGGILLDLASGEIHTWPVNNVTEEFRIPDTMTTIGNNMFKSNTGIRKIIVPGSVNKVGTYAFSLSSIEEVVFEDSTNNGLTIDNYAFEVCTNLKKVRLPYGLTSIGNYSFKGCNQLESIVLPDTLTSIGSAAFKGDTALKDVKLSSRLKELKDETFAGCSALKTINIPESVNKMDITSLSQPFVDCVNLEAINVDENNKTYKSLDGVVYDKAELEIVYYPAAKSGEEYSIPEGVTRVGTKSFSKNNNLTKVTLPSTLQRIGDAAFQGCYNLKTYDFKSMEAPVLEVRYRLDAFNLGWYGNFYDYYFTWDKEYNIAYTDINLNMYYPEGAKGYDSKLYNIFFDTKVETTLENMLGIKNLVVNTAENHDVALTWDKPLWAEGYKIERALLYQKPVEVTDTETNEKVSITVSAPGEFEVLGTVTEEVYTDKALQFGNSYVYKVTAFKDGGGIYGPSNTAATYIYPSNADEIAALRVIDIIEQIPTEITLESKGIIVAARSAYDELTETQKSLVYNYNKLEAAEKALALEEKKAADEAVAKAVEELIKALPAEITLEDEDAIVAARKAYDGLTEEQKALVKSYEVLEKAEKALMDAKKLAVDKGAAKAVEYIISQLPSKVTLDDEKIIKAAREAYDSLTEEQKAFVENYDSLIAAEKSLEDAKKAEEDKNKPSKPSEPGKPGNPLPQTGGLLGTSYIVFIAIIIMGLGVYLIYRRKDKQM